MRSHDRTILWRRIDEVPGTETCALWSEDNTHGLEGLALLTFDGQAVQVPYAVECDAGWRTRLVTVELRGLDLGRSLLLRAEHERWYANGRELRDLRGCVDVDLGATPATNTLPIRRLDLAVGASAEITAAWVRFPDLAVLRLPQRYTRLATYRYRYESGDFHQERGGRTYTNEITVDDLGLVVDYPGAWVRVR